MLFNHACLCSCVGPIIELAFNDGSLFAIMHLIPADYTDPVGGTDV